MTRQVEVRAPGSCGELFQGYLTQSEYLVTLPIALFNVVRLREGLTGSSVKVDRKIEEAYRRTCDFLRISKQSRLDVEITVSREIPVSKGMASSTADILATIYGTASYFNQEVSWATVLGICCAIEKTDSLLFTGMTVMSPKNGHIMFQSDWVPEIQIIVLEPEETLTTEEFHHERNEDIAQGQRQNYQRLFQQFKEVTSERSLKKLGKIATDSASLNQQLLPKPNFLEMKRIVEEFDLLGILTAHSGTVLGLMQEKSKPFPVELWQRLDEEAIQKYYKKKYVVQTTKGGIIQTCNEW